MTEKQLCDQIVEFINYSGKGFVWRTNAGMVPQTYKGKTRMIRIGKKGTSDILGLRKRDGKFVAIEVKLPKRHSRVTLAQVDFLNEIGLFRGLSGVATSPEEAMRILDGE